MMKTLLGLATILAMIAPVSAADLTSIPFKTMNGKTTALKDFPGKAILIVNVASRCGNTPQYEALETLYKKYGPQGLVILGFPANDFGGQEPGTNEEIQQFCSAHYSITFPLLDKIHVKGPEQAPLYAALTGPDAKFPGDVKWNFGKFLVGKNGEVLARFEPGVKPDSPEVVAAIEAALK